MEGHRVVGILCVAIFLVGCCSGYMKQEVSEHYVELPSTAVVPFQYPRYMQCDPLWANNSMNGTGPTDTVCAQGCAMSSIAMALSGRGYFIDSYIPIYPGTFNAWLRNNNGYKCIGGDCDNLVLDAPNGISPSHISFISEDEKPDINTMKAYVQKLNPVMVAHVRNKTHFVLVTGYDSVDPNIFYINDPNHNVTTYNYSDMSDLLLYSM